VTSVSTGLSHVPESNVVFSYSNSNARTLNVITRKYHWDRDLLRLLTESSVGAVAHRWCADPRRIASTTDSICVILIYQITTKGRAANANYNIILSLSGSYSWALAVMVSLSGLFRLPFLLAYTSILNVCFIYSDFIFFQRPLLTFITSEPQHTSIALPYPRRPTPIVE
jgi:hypothetical protein